MSQENNSSSGDTCNQKTGRDSILNTFGIGCFVLILLGIVLLIPAVRAAREAARRMCCVPDEVRTAMHVYHDMYGSFPPAYSTDAEGKPLHSWRVLLLPAFGDIGELANIRLDEPWDSEYNSQFHNKMPRFHGYCCLSRPEKEIAQGLTPYRMIIGPDTISNGPNSTKFSDITRGTSNVIMVVETSIPVPWMKPEDLPQSALQNGVVSSVPRRGKPVVLGIGSPHANGANVAMCDGSCEFFTNEISPEELLEKSRIRKPE